MLVLVGSGVLSTVMHAQWTRRSTPVMMGVSDRMANDGLLYDGWGAEGMSMLNHTASLQQRAESLEISRYDAVLIVAARAKENAYQSAEEDGPAYIGSGFGGPMGAGARRPLPAKSQVVVAIEELLDEVEKTGHLPQLATPGDQSEELERWAEHRAAQDGGSPEADDGSALLSDDATTLRPQEAEGSAPATEDPALDVHEDAYVGQDAETSQDGPVGDADADGDDDDDLLAGLLSHDDGFDDSLSLDHFATEEQGGDDSIEASGMSPGDR